MLVLRISDGVFASRFSNIHSSLMNDDDIVIDPAWVESFSLDIGPEETIQATVAVSTVTEAELAETQITRSQTELGAAETLVVDDSPRVKAASQDLATQKTVLSMSEGTGLSRSLSSAPTRRVQDLSTADATAIDHDYKIGSEIGLGGMGIVYAAEQCSLGRTVALKKRRVDRGQSPELDELFIAEAAVTGLLEHPNIIPVYELGSDEQGSPFYTMKMVQGKSWDTSIDRNDLETNLEILLSISDGLAYAHSKGVIHCDLKPANIMIGAHGENLLVDWGLAMRRAATDEKARPLSPDAKVGGTPAYMPPELVLLSEEDIGPATDTYLLGAMLFRFLTGKTPHDGKSIQSCMMNAAKNVIVEVDESVDAELLAIALKAMANKPEDRYPSAVHFRDAIRACRQQRASDKLLERAIEISNQAQGRLIDYDKSLHLADEARQLWPENPQFTGIREKIHRAYAEAALGQDDFHLAISLSTACGDVGLAIEREARLRLSEQRARRIKLKCLYISSLVCGIIAPIVIFFVIQNSAFEQERAGRALLEASAAKQQAEDGAYFALIAQAESARRQYDHAAARELLNQCPENKRTWEWQLVNHASAGEHELIDLPQLRPRFVLWNGSGTRLIVGDHSGEVFLVDPVVKAVTQSFKSPIHGLRGGALSPDEKRLLLFNTDNLHLLHLESGELLDLKHYELEKGKSLSCMWIDDTVIAVQVGGKELFLVSPETGSTETFETSENIRGMHVSSAGLYYHDQHAIYVLNKGASAFSKVHETDYVLESLSHDGKGLLCTSYLKQGKLLGNLYRVERVDEPAGESSVRQFGRSINNAQQLDDYLVFINERASDKSVFFQSITYPYTLQQMTFPHGITAIAAAPQGDRFAAAHAGAIHIATVPPAQPLSQDWCSLDFTAMLCESHAMYGLNFNGAVEHRDVKTGKLISYIRDPVKLGDTWAEMSSIHRLANGKFLIATAFKVIELDESGSEFRYSLPGSLIGNCVVNPAGTHALISPRGKATELWDVVNRNLVSTFESNDDAGAFVKTACWSPDAVHAVFVDAKSREMRCINTMTGERVWSRVLADRPFRVVSHALGPVLACGEELLVFNWVSGELVKRLRGHQNRICSIAYNSKHNYVLSADREGLVYFWNFNNLEQTLSIRVSESEIASMGTCDDYVGIACKDGMVHCWDLAVGAAP